jgi:antitoxin YefM
MNKHVPALSDLPQSICSCHLRFFQTIDNPSILLYSIPVQKGLEMTIQTTYTQARDGLAKLLDQVTHNREVVVIQRRGEEEVAMIAASELESLMETAYLLRSPANAERLLSALGRALKNETQPLPINALRHEVGLE